MQPTPALNPADGRSSVSSPAVIGSAGLIEVAQNAGSSSGQAGYETPAWFEQTLLSQLLASVHWQFLLTGAWSDYVAERTPAVEWMARALAVDAVPPFKVVVSWSPARGTDNGWWFLTPSMRAEFCRVMGIEDASASMTEADKAVLRDQGVKIPDGPVLPRGERAAIECLLEFLQRAEPQSTVAFIERMEIVCPAKRDTDIMSPDQSAIFGQLTEIGRDPERLTRYNPLIMVAPSSRDVHKAFRHPDANVREVRIGLPERVERQAFTREQLLIESARAAELQTSLEMSIDEFASMTASCYRRHLEDMFLQARAAAQSTGRKPVVTRDLVRAHKKVIMSAQFADVLEEMLVNVSMDDIGGQFRVKRWLDENVFLPVDMGRPDLMKKAVVLLGPGGTGKTYLAKAIAKRLGWNMVEFKTIKDKYVGESEKLIDEALEGVFSMRRVVLFIDELDQKFQRGEGSDGGSSVEKYIFARLMEFLARDDIIGEVFTIGNSNRPDLCDPALFRIGRFDEKIPILPPESDEERADLFGVLLQRRAGTSRDYLLTNPAPLARIATATNGWTQAEIDGAVRDAARAAVLRQTDVLDALEAVVRKTRSTTGDVEYMTLLAVQATADNDLLPEKYQRKVADQSALRDELVNLRPVAERDISSASMPRIRPQGR